MTPKQLKTAMSKLKVDEYGLAELTGVNHTTVWRYLNDKRKIPEIFSRFVKLVIANGKDQVIITLSAIKLAKDGENDV